MTLVHCIPQSSVATVLTSSILKWKRKKKAKLARTVLQFPDPQFVASPKQKKHRANSLRPNENGRRISKTKITRKSSHLRMHNCSSEDQPSAQNLPPFIEIPIKGVEFRTNGKIYYSISSHKGRRPKNKYYRNGSLIQSRALVSILSPCLTKKLDFEVCGVQHQISWGLSG